MKNLDEVDWMDLVDKVDGAGGKRAAWWVRVGVSFNDPAWHRIFCRRWRLSHDRQDGRKGRSWPPIFC